MKAVESFIFAWLGRNLKTVDSMQKEYQILVGLIDQSDNASGEQYLTNVMLL